MLKPITFFLLVFALLLTSGISNAQELNNRRAKKLVIAQDTTSLDSLTIAFNSASISGKSGLLDAADYAIDYARGLLIWKGEAFPADSIEIAYRVLPIQITTEYKHKDLQRMEPDASGKINPFKYTTTNPQNEDVFKLSGLNKSGSISRGVSFGNNQDLSVNSNLSLQLSGKLNDNVSILASVTDNNIPIQPDGNTQQLQDFDQVYIQIYDDKSKLIAGDFQLKTPSSYFMRYFKRTQGGSVSTSFGMGSYEIPGTGEVIPAAKMKVSASAAVSKGKFARNVIQGIEGNQGPYRLQGADNETFIIILAGTERVYIDGQLLTRGQENDYIIDYNTAEVVFTPNRLITKDKRITIEFQYSDKNYARSLLQFSNEFEKDKLKLRLHLYSEQDSKNQPLQQDLTPEDKEVLSNVGDSLQFAIVPSIQQVEFSNDQILYAMVDSLGYDSVFVYSTAPDSAIYQLSFSNVGSGNGDYLQTDFTATGRVFEWVAPDTINNVIVRRGDYEPVIVLIAPKKQQMFVLGADYDFSDRTRAGVEIAYSDKDINTFSRLDGSNDQGYAIRTTLENNTPIQQKENPWTLGTSVVFETVEKNFNRIERFRTVEFERNWNIQNTLLTESQYVTTAGIGLHRKKTGEVNYNFNSFNVGNEYNGYKNDVNANLKFTGLDLRFNGSLLNTTGFNKTAFIRHKSRIAKRLKFFVLGFKDEHEQNEFFDVDSDSLLNNSYRFYDWEVFATNIDTTKNRFSMYYKQRYDHAVNNNTLRESTFAEAMGFTFDLIKNPRNQLRGKAAYRKLTITNDELTAQEPDNTLLGRLEYSVKLLKGSINSSTFYEIGSGLEQKKEFVYVEVPAGQGVYEWIDYDDDNVKDLNEFEIASFPDRATYIRVFTPTTEYVKTFTNQFNQVLNLRPAALWRDKTGILKFIGRFSNQTAFRVDRKTNEDDATTAYNPFLRDVADSTLLALNSSIRNTVSFNRTNSKFGIDYTYQSISSKSLLTNGFDARDNLLNEGRVRWNITRQVTMIVRNEVGKRSTSSDFLTNRNYNIDYITAETKFSYQPGTTFRVSVKGEYTEKKNDQDLGGELAEIQDYGTELKYNVVSKGSFLATFNFINIAYNGLTNTSLAFEMLNALQVGKNYTWGLSFQRNLANNMQLSVNYSGRQSEDAPTIHTGGVQVRAFF